MADLRSIITNMDKEFNNRIRLGLMAAMMIEDWIEFKTMKHLLDLTDGNLASHVAALETCGYMEVRKKFIGKRPNTSYRITPTGRRAFEHHLKQMEELIQKSRS